MTDGNTKNARTVCSVKNVGQIIFEGIGSVTVGKYNNLIKETVTTVLCGISNAKRSAGLSKVTTLEGLVMLPAIKLVYIILILTFS